MQHGHCWFSPWWQACDAGAWRCHWPTRKPHQCLRGGSPDEVRRLACEAIVRVNDGACVLVITDVMGDTPSNCTLQLCVPGEVEVIAGISLPMLLRAMTYRHNSLDVTVEMALAGGQTGACRVDNRIRLAPN